MSKFLADLAKKEVLVPHLDAWFKQNFDGHAEIPLTVNPYKAPDTAFHPSSDAVGCARLLYAKFNPEIEMVERKFNAKTGLNGHMWHALIQHIVCHELKFCRPEDVERRYGKSYEGTPLPWDMTYEPAYALWWATGLVDLVNVKIPGHDEKFLIDIKTMMPSSFAMPTPPDFLWNKYVAQCQLYMDWTGYDKCIILGIEAGSPFNFKEIVINRDEAYPEYIYDKWSTVAEALATNTPPPHSCDYPDNCASNTLYGNAKEASSS